jgi:hypothetical protein
LEEAFSKRDYVMMMMMMIRRRKRRKGRRKEVNEDCRKL